MESSTLVIKVKYGETLRRFNAQIDDEELRLDIIELREKVVSLFSFPTDSELTLTYIDEDGDVVTLADEEDLYDIMRQSLNPLRISVSLNTESSGRSHGRSSGNSYSMRSPRVQTQILTESISEIVKSLPKVIRESLRERLSRLFIELGSNAKSSRPGYTELLDSLSKMSLTNPEEDSVPHTKSGPSGSIKDATVPKEKNYSKADGIKPAAELKYNEADQRNLTGFSAGFVRHAADSADALRGDKLSIGSLSANRSPGSFVVGGDQKKDEAEKLAESNERGNYNSGLVQGNRVSTKSPGDKMKEIKKANESLLGCKSVGVGSLNPNNYLNPQPLNFLASDTGGFTGKKVATRSGNSLGSQFGINSFGEYPFTGVPIENYSSSVPGCHYAPGMVPIKRSYSHSDGFGVIFHRGVRCDGCGVHPITGPRFKSKVKEDYDLCGICFEDMGNETDYIRMDRPMSYMHPVSLNGFYDPMQSYWGRPPKLPQVLRGSASQSKLDSRFIQDVNIIDGTIMAPSTQFTKIWRLRNNGTVVWPQGTQLLWIGGDRFSKILSTGLEIPANGWPVDKEIDIAVDFSAPAHPGCYISYWRMASPSGQKFGQRVWVLIQVDASLKDSFSKTVHDFNLNLPPVSSIMMSSQIENASVQPMIEDSLPKPDNFNRASELVEPVVDAPSNKYQGLNFPINDTLLVGGDIPNPAPLDASSLPIYPTVDFPEVEPIATSPAQTSNIDMPSSVVDVRGKDEVELTLLKELEKMGFKQIDLNKEILRMNEYNLEQSVDDLCGVEDWDPILKELQEMGFSDKKMNKMLLKKNNGSIKRVVMDLIAGEKA